MRNERIIVFVFLTFSVSAVAAVSLQVLLTESNSQAAWEDPCGRENNIL